MKIKISFTSFLLYFFIVPALHSQKIRYTGEINLQGIASSQAEIPFWMYSNRRGRISEDTDIATWISGRAVYDLGRSGFLEAGGGFLYNNDSQNEAFLDELFVTYTYRWLQITAGRKQRPELYNGLSASNESILWSLNARPLPGLLVGTKDPVFFSGQRGFGFEVSWEEYFMEEERFVSNAKLHHKNLRLVYRSSIFEVKAGLQHFVQWGGTSLNGSIQPDGLEDYFRVITGQGGSENANGGDQLNALGNHLGGYEFYFTRFYPDFKVELLYNHLFDDKSGMRLGNTPDGRYGLFVDFSKKKKWINAVMCEFYYTKHQSSTTSGAHIWDNYFNNFLYQSGWTYEGKTIGSPFFVPNSYDESHAEGYVRVGNNNFVAYHIGISGVGFQKVPYKFLTSYRRNYGHYRIAGDYKSEYYPPDDPRGEKIIPEEVVSTFLEVAIPNGWMNLNIAVGADFTPEKANVGVGLSLQKRF